MYKEEMEFSRIKKIPKYFLMFWLEAADLRQFRVFFFEKVRKRERRSTRFFGFKENIEHFSREIEVLMAMRDTISPIRWQFSDTHCSAVVDVYI